LIKLTRSIFGQSGYKIRTLLLKLSNLSIKEEDGYLTKALVMVSYISFWSWSGNCNYCKYDPRGIYLDRGHQTKQQDWQITLWNPRQDRAIKISLQISSLQRWLPKLNRLVWQMQHIFGKWNGCPWHEPQTLLARMEDWKSTDIEEEV